MEYYSAIKRTKLSHKKKKKKKNNAICSNMAGTKDSN